MTKQKQCRYCKKYYPESKFGVALTTKNKIYRRHKCINCYREMKTKLKQKYREWLVNYKKQQKCAKCGVSDFRILEFHHKNNQHKEFSIGMVTTNQYGLDRIKKEMAKCIIICANCHRILHYNELHRNKKKGKRNN